MGRARRLFATVLIAATLALAMVLSGPAAAQPSDAAVKAAFLPRFARYVTWPAGAAPSGSAPFVLCVVGRDPFGKLLDTAAQSQSIDGRRITVRRLASPGGAGGCNIAFVEGGRGQPVGQILAGLAGKPILTVTDASSGGQRGIIHFTMVGGRVRFFIDEAQAASRGLSISSRLLALAVAVRQR